MTQVFFFPPGWRSDFHYYSANNHPLHGIVASDPHSRLSRNEWLLLEVATIGFMVCTGNLQESWVLEKQAPIAILSNPRIFKLAIVTIPGVLVWQMLFFLFTCPTCLVDESSSTSAVKSKAHWWSHLGEKIGHFCMGLGLLANIWILHKTHMIGETTIIETVVVSRLEGYIISWLMMLLLTFNPFLAWGQPDPKGGFCLGEYIGIGQWRIEKQRFQHHCIKALTTWLSKGPRPSRPGGGSEQQLVGDTMLSAPTPFKLVGGPSTLYPVDSAGYEEDSSPFRSQRAASRTCCQDPPIETVSRPRSTGNKPRPLEKPPSPKAKEPQGAFACMMQDGNCIPPKPMTKTCESQLISCGEDIFGA